MTNVVEKNLGRKQQAGVYGNENTVLNIVRKPRFEIGDNWVAEVKRGSPGEQFCARPNVQCANNPIYGIALRGFSEKRRLVVGQPNGGTSWLRTGPKPPEETASHPLAIPYHASNRVSLAGESGQASGMAERASAE